MSKDCYLGNTGIKGDGVITNYTKEELDEYLKCAKDPAYFCKKYLRIIHVDRGLVDFNLYDYQRKMFDNFNHNRFNIVLAARQAGKSVAVCAYLLWRALFHSEKTIAILANKGATSREMLGRITLMLESVPFFLQPGCKILNKGNVDFSNNSKIIAASTSGSSIRGMAVSDLYLDELAFVERADEFFTSTYPVVASGKDTRVIITSTPNGIGNLFYRMWQNAIIGASDFKSLKVTWKDVPGRDAEWKRQTIANTSALQFGQEHDCDFLGSSDTLIDSNTLLGLSDREPETVAADVKIYKTPVAGHNYVMAVDVSKGRGSDYSTFNIIDISGDTFEQVAVFRNNMISPMILPDLLHKYAMIYNEAIVLIENNDAGVVVCNGLYYDIEYENVFVESYVKKGGIGVAMTKSIKRVGCSNMKDILENGRLTLYDKETIYELTCFCQKGTSYEATDGNHDDLVMNLVLFAWFVSTAAFGEINPMDLKSLLHSERLLAMEDDMLDMPIYMDDGTGGSYKSEAQEEAIQMARDWMS
jgi:hypothetical protein